MTAFHWYVLLGGIGTLLGFEITMWLDRQREFGSEIAAWRADYQKAYGGE